MAICLGAVSGRVAWGGSAYRIRGGSFDTNGQRHREHGSESTAGECLPFVYRVPPSSVRLRCLGEGTSGIEELMGEAVIGAFTT